jgi:hypothetical protein
MLNKVAVKQYNGMLEKVLNDHDHYHSEQSPFRSTYNRSSYFHDSLQRIHYEKNDLLQPLFQQLFGTT